MNPRVETILTQLLEGVITPNIQANKGDIDYLDALHIYIDITGAPHLLPMVELGYGETAGDIELPF